MMVPQRNGYAAEDAPGRLGRTLVAQFFVLLKTSSHYPEGHAAVATSAANVLNVLGEIQRENEEASLRLKGNHLFLGEYRLKAESAGYEATRVVMEAMKRHLVGRLLFSPEVTGEELAGLVYVLREVDEAPGGDPYARVLELMQQRKIAGIEVEMLPEEEESVEVDREKLRDDRLKAKVFYRRMVAAMEEVMASAAAGQPLKLRECKRLVQHMIDLLPSQEATLLGLTTNRSRELYTENHSANVSILSLAMGRRLGISKFHLSELGMAALFHDIGKAEVPREILDKGGELSEAERRAMEAHPVLGVKQIMMLKRLDAMTATIITGAFEHHLLADHSGYPRLPYKGNSLVGRIISIADSYEGLTSRVNGPLAPDKALRCLLTRAGKEYDQALLKLLVNCLGVYPVGSLVLLDSGELAVVVEKSAEPAQWDHPKVKVIADSAGREIDGGIVDLGRVEPRRSILAPLDPAPFSIDVSRYFV